MSPINGQLQSFNKDSLQLLGVVEVDFVVTAEILVVVPILVVAKKILAKNILALVEEILEVDAEIWSWRSIWG